MSQDDGKVQSKMHCKVQCKRLELMLYRLSNFFVFISCFDVDSSCFYRYTRNKKHKVFVFRVPNSILEYMHIQAWCI